MAGDLFPEQKAFFDKVRSAQAGKIIILTGEAGSGKTQCIAALPECVAPRRVKYLVPTHQAKSVLTERLTASGVNSPDVVTVASFLCKRPNRSTLPPEDDLFGLNFEQGTGHEPVQSGSILVADESSMLSLNDLHQITELTTRGVFVICGDFAQLGPVNSASIFQTLMSGVVQCPDRVEVVELKKNLRAESQQLVEFLNMVRQSGNFPDDGLPDDGSVFYARSRTEFDQLWLDALRKHDPANVVRLAYTNKTVNAAAVRARQTLGYSGQFFEPGEIIRVDAPFRFIEWAEARDMAGRESTRDEIKAILDRYSLNTGDLVKVISVAKDVTAVSFPWVPGVSMPTRATKLVVLSGACKGETFTKNLCEIGACSDSGSSARKLVQGARVAAKAAAAGNLNMLTDQSARRAVEREMSVAGPHAVGNWWFGKLFWNVRDTVVAMSSALSMTTHKAQGTGVDYVFVDSRDMAGPEANELRYTAASRARKKLVVLK